MNRLGSIILLTLVLMAALPVLAQTAPEKAPQRPPRRRRRGTITARRFWRRWATR